MLLIALVALTLGVYGLRTRPAESGGPVSLLDLPYAVIHIFLLRIRFDPPYDSLPLSVARLLAMVLFVYGLRAVLVVVIGKVRHTLRKPGGHTVIIGAGQYGQEIARQTLQGAYRSPADETAQASVSSASSRVGHPSVPVVAFVDPSRLALDEAASHFPDVFTYQGDGTDPLVLEDACLADARRVVITMNDEMAAVAAALAVGRFIKDERQRDTENGSGAAAIGPGRSTRREQFWQRYGLDPRTGRLGRWLRRKPAGAQAFSGPVECHVQVNRLFHGVVFSQIGLFQELVDHMILKPFDPCVNAARQVLNEHPLDGPCGIAPREDCRPVLAISGCGAMGEALLLQAARIGHYANHRRLTVMVLDPEGEARRRDILFRCPELEKIVDLEFVTFPLEHQETLSRLETIAADPSVRLTVAICLSDALRAVEQAMFLPAAVVDRSLQVLVRLDDEDRLRFFPACGTRPRDTGASKFKVFGMLEQVANLRAAEDGEWLARLIHDTCREKAREDGCITPFRAVPWDKLDPDIRETRQLQAEHAFVKLRAVGYQVEPHAPTDGEHQPVVLHLTPEEIEALAESEHNRWNADRWLAGWRTSPPGSKKDSVTKTTPYLVPYANFDEETKYYNRRTIRDILLLVERGRVVLRKVRKH